MRSRLKLGGAALAVSSALLVASGCSSTSPTPSAQAAVGAVKAAPVSRAAIEFAPSSSSVDVPPGQPAVVTATNGKLTDVRLTDEKGRTVEGELSADGLTWTSRPLKVARHYRLHASAVDAQGRAKERTGFFATVAPREVLETSISPLDGQSVGVGMPVIVRFSERVKNRAAVEEALTVTSAKPIVGSWSWVSDEEIHFRPKEFWPAYNKVTVDVDL
jgi:hypothetical protein